MEFHEKLQELRKSRGLTQEELAEALFVSRTAISKWESGATYPEIKARVLEQTGLKVSSLYISQVKQKCGLEVRENHHKAKSENTKQPQCPKEKEDAIVEALKHFQMI